MKKIPDILKKNHDEKVTKLVRRHEKKVVFDISGTLNDHMIIDADISRSLVKIPFGDVIESSACYE